MADTPDPKRQKFPLQAQADFLHDELQPIYRRYLKQAQEGKISQADADKAIALMRACRDTMRLFAAYEDDIRAVIRAKLDRQRENDEIAELEKHPAVAAVRRTFPDAKVGLPAKAPLYETQHELEPVE